MKEIKIRKAQKSDADQYVRLTAKVWRSAYAHFVPSEVFDKMDADIDAQTKRISETLGTENIKTSGRICYVAVDGKRIVAYAFAGVSGRYEYYEKQGCCGLYGMNVDPEYQGLGLGKKLFNMVASKFFKHGYTKMFNGVLKENIKARGFYEKMGGQLDSYEKPFEKLGYSFPEVFYTYDLGKPCP